MCTTNPTFPPTWTTTLPSSCWDGCKLIHSLSHTKKFFLPFFPAVDFIYIKYLEKEHNFFSVFTAPLSFSPCSIG